MKFDCTSVNPNLKGDISVGYGRGAQAGVGQRARTDAEAVADRDAAQKARNEHECASPCGIRGVAAKKNTTIVVPAWQDSKGVWHATAQCKWSLTVHCVLGAAAKTKKSGKTGKTGNKGKTGKKKP